MKVLNKSILLLLTSCLLMGTSCGKKTEETSSTMGDNVQTETISTTISAENQDDENQDTNPAKSADGSE